MQTRTQTQNKKEIEVHDYDNRIRRYYKLIETNLSKDNSELITKYDQYLARESLSKAYRCKQLETIYNLSRLFDKYWKDITKDDVDTVVYKVVQTFGDQKGQETNTTADYKKYLKMFFRWIILGSRHFREVGDPPQTKEIRIKRVKDRLVREELIDDNDYDKLIRACSNARTRAMIAVQYEGGTRPGENLSLKIKHVKFDKIGAIIAVDGKTTARPIRLIKAVPHLAAWLSEHPDRDNPDAPLYVQTEGKNIGQSLSYMAARKSLLNVARKAGLSKRIFLNLFRHSEATELANFMTEAQLRKRHGWSSTSKMPARYVHLVNADVEDAILQHYGIKKENKKDSKNLDLPTKCTICDMLNTSDSRLCAKCGKPLDLETAISMEEKERNELDQIKLMQQQTMNMLNLLAEKTGATEILNQLNKNPGNKPA